MALMTQAHRSGVGRVSEDVEGALIELRGKML
jgi:hypothetical protein